MIEFTHRAMTGLDTPLVALLLIWAFRAFPRHHPVRLAATLSGVFLVTEALLGALLVKLQHVAKNADAYTLSTHLVNTLTLLACLALTAWWAMGNPAPRLRGKAAWMAAISLGAVMLLSITGAISALGDTLSPPPRWPPGWRRISTLLPTSCCACGACIRCLPPPWERGSRCTPWAACALPRATRCGWSQWCGFNSSRAC